MEGMVNQNAIFNLQVTVTQIGWKKKHKNKKGLDIQMADLTYNLIEMTYCVEIWPSVDWNDIQMAKMDWLITWLKWLIV